MTMNDAGKVEMTIEETKEQIQLLEQERQGSFELSGIFCCCYECSKNY